MTQKQKLVQELLVTVVEMCEGCAADGDVEGCLGDDCSLFAARLGQLPGRKAHGWLIKVIRTRCLDCMNDQAREVLCCESKKCPLWPWREGTGIPASTDQPSGIDAILFGDQDPDEMTATDILFGDQEDMV